MVEFSPEETASVATIATVLCVFAWYQTQLTGIQRWTNVVVVLLVGAVSATVGLVALKRLDPAWYSS